MGSGTSEALKDAVRRGLPLVVVLVLLGAAALIGIRQYQGPEYEASAHVFVSTSNIASAVAGTQVAFVDPRRAIDNAIALARSGGLFEQVEARTEGKLGSADEIRAATSVNGSSENDVLAFRASSDQPERSVAIANAVAEAYPEYRAEIARRDIDRALAELRSEIATSPDPVLQQKREQLELLQALLKSGDATVIERADDAVKVNPRPIRDGALGAALGLIVGLLLGGAREALNTRVRTDADVEQLLESPVLASIQTLPKRSRLVTLGGRHEARFSDTYALLAANFMHLRGDASSTVLAVTSATKGEGKTTTAANLAVALARRGARVVLVDFDLRRPSIGSVFRVPPDSPGLIQMVNGDLPFLEGLWQVPVNGSEPAGLRVLRRENGQPPDELERHSERDGAGGSLHVVPAGGSLRTGVLSRSPRAAQILSSLKEEADVVILDTPPALATAEMTELSRLVDMILVVARQGRVTRRSLQTLHKQSQAWQSEVIGAVVTGTPAEDRYSYYGS